MDQHLKSLLNKDSCLNTLRHLIIIFMSQHSLLFVNRVSSQSNVITITFMKPHAMTWHLYTPITQTLNKIKHSLKSSSLHRWLTEGGTQGQILKRRITLYSLWLLHNRDGARLPSIITCLPAFPLHFLALASAKPRKSSVVNTSHRGAITYPNPDWLFSRST